MDLKRVSVHEAVRLIAEEGYALIDVRSVVEFDETHSEGAWNIPFLHKTAQGMIPNADFGPVVESKFPDKGSKLLLIGAMGARSVRACQDLMARGYTAVMDVKGGFGGEYDDDGAVLNPGWQASGLPTQDGASEGRAYRSLEPKPLDKKEAADMSRVTELQEDLPDDAEGINRFASRRRKVDCVKLRRELPGLKRRPYPGVLGERIFNEVSAEAWNEWVEHSKMIINEYRINSADPASIKLLMEQCEAFIFGEGVARPEGYVPA